MISRKSAVAGKALVFLALALTASAKDRDWITGKVVEVGSERFGVGNTGKLAWALGQPHATHDKGVQYTIQVDNTYYVAVEMSMAHHKLKEERAAAGDSIKFALQGETKLILLDADGKERTLQLLRKTTKAPEPVK